MSRFVLELITAALDKHEPLSGSGAGAAADGAPAKWLRWAPCPAVSFRWFAMFVTQILTGRGAGAPADGAPASVASVGTMLCGRLSRSPALGTG